MRMSQEEKVRTHARIVASASHLFREKGIEGAGVGDVMSAAGMTVGGFYKHFDSKEALVAKALDDAFANFVQTLDSEAAAPAYKAFKALYLSHGHLSNAGRGCPVATLGQEIARASGNLKSIFGTGVRSIVDRIAVSRHGSAAARRASALREFSMLVGAMVIARASDHSLAEEVLVACGGDEAKANTSHGTSIQK